MKYHKGHYGKYSGNAKWSKDHAHTRVTKENYDASVADDAAHIDYLKRDVLYDDHHGHSDEKMTADEKHISKLAGDMKYDKEHHDSPAKMKDKNSGKSHGEMGKKELHNHGMVYHPAKPPSGKEKSPVKRVGTRNEHSMGERDWAAHIKTNHGFKQHSGEKVDKKRLNRPKPPKQKPEPTDSQKKVSKAIENRNK